MEYFETIEKCREENKYYPYTLTTQGKPLCLPL